MMTQQHRMTLRKLLRNCAAPVMAALVASGCGGDQGVAPLGRAEERADSAVPSKIPRRVSSGARGVSVRANQHRVRSGETLYGIAWGNSLDYRRLASWNGIGPPYTVYPGQTLSLRAPGGTVDTPARSAPKPTSLPPSTPKRATRVPAAQGSTASQSSTGAAKKPPLAKVSKLRANRAAKTASSGNSSDPLKVWAWPTDGRVVTTFAASGGKGIDISGNDGQAIVAAASGEVVYGGSGLRGYGQLIIVKHNKNFLSAYAHNKKLHVAEGDKVVKGQRIADMGRTGSERIQLHFEIRASGKPVDPFRYLPRKPGRRN